jgi:hypothetical protein
MAVRFVMKKSADSYFERTWKIILALFDGASLEDFVAEKLANLADSVNWDQPMRDAAFDLISLSLREWHYADVISALVQNFPQDQQLAQLVTALVDGGIINSIAE